MSADIAGEMRELAEQHLYDGATDQPLPGYDALHALADRVAVVSLTQCAPDCAERALCPKVGVPGHWQCGVCPKHNAPRHHCGCFAPAVLNEGQA